MSAAFPLDCLEATGEGYSLEQTLAPSFEQPCSDHGRILASLDQDPPVRQFLPSQVFMAMSCLLPQRDVFPSEGASLQYSLPSKAAQQGSPIKKILD